MRLGVFRELDVFPSASQPLDVPSTWFNGHVIIRCAMKKSNRSITHLFVIEKNRVALRIKRDVSSEFQTGPSVHALKAAETGIERHRASSGKAHKHDTGGVDSRVLR